MIKINMKWSFFYLWNESLERDKSRELKERDTIWASELGGAMIDRYLKMKAVKPTNPPNPRSLRKFEAGNIWEAIIGYVLMRAGILQQRQEWVLFQYPNLLPVSGKLDFIAGGQPDYDKAISLIGKEFNWLPEFISRATEKIVVKLKEQYPNGLKDIILELKSCSAYMFENYERKQTGSLQHKLQCFHYLKAKNMKEGHIVYVCKDDARLLEIGVFNPSYGEDLYFNDIKTMTEFLRKGEQPPLEKFIVFDSDFGKFSANWKVAYSQYLTMLYGLENQKAFDDKYKPIVERWNRVLGRMEENKEMTSNNSEAIGEMVEAGFNVEEITKTIKEKGEKQC